MVFYLVILADSVDFSYTNEYSLFVILLASEILERESEDEFMESLKFHMNIVYILQFLLMK